MNPRGAGQDSRDRALSNGYFVRYQAERQLTESELVGLVRGLTLLRDENSILGWRLAHEHAGTPRVSIEIRAEDETDAQVKTSLVFVEALAAARLDEEAGVFTLGETVARAGQ